MNHKYEIFCKLQKLSHKLCQKQVENADFIGLIFITMFAVLSKDLLSIHSVELHFMFVAIRKSTRLRKQR